MSRVNKMATALPRTIAVACALCSLHARVNAASWLTSVVEKQDPQMFETELPSMRALRKKGSEKELWVEPKRAAEAGGAGRESEPRTESPDEGSLAGWDESPVRTPPEGEPERDASSSSSFLAPGKPQATPSSTRSPPRFSPVTTPRQSILEQVDRAAPTAEILRDCPEVDSSPVGGKGKLGLPAMPKLVLPAERTTEEQPLRRSAPMDKKEKQEQSGPAPGEDEAEDEDGTPSKRSVAARIRLFEENFGRVVLRQHGQSSSSAKGTKVRNEPHQPTDPTQVFFIGDGAGASSDEEDGDELQDPAGSPSKRGLSGVVRGKIAQLRGLGAGGCGGGAKTKAGGAGAARAAGGSRSKETARDATCAIDDETSGFERRSKQALTSGSSGAPQRQRDGNLQTEQQRKKRVDARHRKLRELFSGVGNLFPGHMGQNFCEMGDEDCRAALATHKDCVEKLFAIPDLCPEFAVSALRRIALWLQERGLQVQELPFWVRMLEIETALHEGRRDDLVAELAQAVERQDDGEGPSFREDLADVLWRQIDEEDSRFMQVRDELEAHEERVKLFIANNFRHTEHMV